MLMTRPRTAGEVVSWMVWLALVSRVSTHRPTGIEDGAKSA